MGALEFRKAEWDALPVQSANRISRATRVRLGQPAVLLDGAIEWLVFDDHRLHNIEFANIGAAIADRRQVSPQPEDDEDTALRRNIDLPYVRAVSTTKLRAPDEREII